MACSNLLSEQPQLFDIFCRQLGRDSTRRRQWLADWGRKNLSEEAYEQMRAATSGQCAVEGFRVIELLARTIESMR